MKGYWALAAAGFAVLSAAAVWLGGLNQDEGWYLYAASQVADGRLPYRDFFFTQGPVMPLVYSAFAGVWRSWGLLGGRILTLVAGAGAIAFAAALAARIAPARRRSHAALATFLVLGCNIYHLYYSAIPKTYALASLFVAAAFWLASFVPWDGEGRPARAAAFGSGLLLAFAAGTRISLAAMIPAVAVALLAARHRRHLAWFAFGAAAGLAVAYGPFALDPLSRSGLVAAQRFHAARGGGGHSIVWAVGSLSRLVRWHLPLFAILGLGLSCRAETEDDDPSAAREGRAFRGAILGAAALAFAVQMCAPFPYEDYQTPLAGIVAAYAAASAAPLKRLPLLALGLSFACSFGSPLLEKWHVNGHDRFWPLMKEKCEMAQLRDVARRIERLDPGGRELFTQDVYLAVETNRRVPEGLEMGPFAVLDDAGLERIVDGATAPVAALSGYAFAISMPEGVERPAAAQERLRARLLAKYEPADEEKAFGQGATTLVILKRRK